MDDKTELGIKQSVPYIVYESLATKADGRDKRSSIIIGLLIFLLVVTNGLWLGYESQFECIETTETTITETYEVDTKGYVIDNIVGSEVHYDNK